MSDQNNGMSGTSMIAAERQRQIDDERWSPEHDDEDDDFELAQAAECYVAAGYQIAGMVQWAAPNGEAERLARQLHPDDPKGLADALTRIRKDREDPVGACYGRDRSGNVKLPSGYQWPEDWEAEVWKPSADPVHNLVKAGALIAAEIDRLQRASESEQEARDG